MGIDKEPHYLQTKKEMYRVDYLRDEELRDKMD